MAPGVWGPPLGGGGGAYKLPPPPSRLARSPARAGAQGAGGRSHLQLWRNESGAAAAAAAERVWHPESPGIENNLGKAVGGVCARAPRGGRGSRPGGVRGAGGGAIRQPRCGENRVDTSFLSTYCGKDRGRLNPLTARRSSGAARAPMRARRGRGPGAEALRRPVSLAPQAGAPAGASLMEASPGLFSIPLFLQTWLVSEPWPQFPHLYKRAGNS